MQLLRCVPILNQADALTELLDQSGNIPIGVNGREYWNCNRANHHEFMHARRLSSGDQI